MRSAKCTPLDQTPVVASISKAWELDSLRLSTAIQKKCILFVPDDFEVPLQLQTDEFRIRPLRESDAELDYEAIMSSVDFLKGVLGRRDWPSEDMTLEEDRLALRGHEREFEIREGFVYTVVNLDETKCLGCVYIYPSRWDDCDAEVLMWVTVPAFESGMGSRLFSTTDKWLRETWPFERVVYPGRIVPWGEFFDKLNRQDHKYH